jgi:redox-sensitive bicupin YhaK (pirin superfamily)
MATVERKVTPGKTDPFGTGKILVTDCLDKFAQTQSDPFLLLHHFGPAHISAMPQFGMHPHRGFNECPYLKQGRWLGTDPWNMSGEGQDALFAEGQLQWGKSGRGIEHGMKFDPTYDGPVQGFQLWINLRSENKLDPPEFQNARADAMPLVDVAPGVRAKVLLGELNGQASPVETQGIRCQYVDYELDANAEATHPRTNGMSTLFVYVYEGSGTFCGMFQCPWYAIDATAREIVEPPRHRADAVTGRARAQGPQRKRARSSACRRRATCTSKRLPDWASCSSLESH